MGETILPLNFQAVWKSNSAINNRIVTFIFTEHSYAHIFLINLVFNTFSLAFCDKDWIEVIKSLPLSLSRQYPSNDVISFIYVLFNT